MFSLSRREFLKGSALLAASAATVAVTDSSSEAAPLPQPGSGPNETINVAVIGVKGRGMDHIRGLAGRHNCRVTHVCDVDMAVIQPALNLCVKQQGGAPPTIVKDMRNVFDNNQVHVVTVATPNHWHSLAAIWALQAGKDVYVEKPVSHNVWEGRRLVDIAHAQNRICQAGTQIRSAPGIRQAIAFLHANKLGQVRVARGLCYKRRRSIGRVQGVQPIPGSCNYNLWCGPAPHRPLNRLSLHYDWHWQWDYGNGDLGNQGIHQMDVCRWGLNKSELPRAALSLGGRFGYIDDGETANTQICWFDYGNSQEVIFEVRGLETKPLRSVTVGNIFHCADGYMVMPNYTTAIVYDRDGKELQRFTGADTHYQNFISCVRSRRRQDLNGEVLEGHLSSAMCHLGNISYRLGQQQAFVPRAKAFGDSQAAQDTLVTMEEHLTANEIPLAKTNYNLGRRLTVDVKNERFLNNDEANRLLTREYRKPFVVPARQ
jgi:predicted dehydrogenase